MTSLAMGHSIFGIYSPPLLLTQLQDPMFYVVFVGDILLIISLLGVSYYLTTSKAAVKNAFATHLQVMVWTNITYRIFQYVYLTTDIYGWPHWIFIFLGYLSLGMLVLLQMEILKKFTQVAALLGSSLTAERVRLWEYLACGLYILCCGSHPFLIFFIGNPSAINGWVRTWFLTGATLWVVFSAAYDIGQSIYQAILLSKYISTLSVDTEGKRAVKSDVSKLFLYIIFIVLLDLAACLSYIFGYIIFPQSGGWWLMLSNVLICFHPIPFLLVTSQIRKVLLRSSKSSSVQTNLDFVNSKTLDQ